jgi:heme exporter protein D
MNLIENIQFASFAEFLDMGGYAFNVWSVYALFAVFIAVNLIAPMLRRRQLIKELRRRQAIDERYGARGSESQQGEINS